MRSRFQGHAVWITGGGSGIGAALALEFAREGAAVAVSGRRADRLQDVVNVIGATGSRALAVRCDVTDEASIARAAEAVVHEFGRLDVAIANAGFSVTGHVEKLSADDWRRQYETNVIGLAVTAKHALGELRKTQGRMVLMGSVAGLIASPNSAAYSSSKAAVRMIGETLAMELYGSGVTCTTLEPGFVESEIAQVNNRGQFDPARVDRRPPKLLWRTDRAARVCVDAIHARKREFVFTGHGKLGAFIGRHLPSLAYVAMTRGLAPRGRPAE